MVETPTLFTSSPCSTSNPFLPALERGVQAALTLWVPGAELRNGGFFCSTAVFSAGDKILGRWEGATSTPDFGVCGGHGGVQDFSAVLLCPLCLHSTGHHPCGATGVTLSILRCAGKVFTSNIKRRSSLRLLKAGSEPII